MPDRIEEFHAHVYYELADRQRAATLRAAIEERWTVRMGRWWDRPIGPHPMPSYQVAFAPELFGEIVPWLALNRDGLDIFVHPNTGDDIPDHTSHVMFLGRSYELDLDALRRPLE